MNARLCDEKSPAKANTLLIRAADEGVEAVG